MAAVINVKKKPKQKPPELKTKKSSPTPQEPVQTPALSDMLAAHEEQQKQQEQKQPEQQHDYIIIYSENCLSCLHLAPTLGTKAYKDCHFSAGNEDCPAAKLRIVIGVNVERTARIMARAIVDNNLAKLTRMNNRLMTKDPVMISQVMALVQQYIRDGIPPTPVPVTSPAA